MEVRQSDKASSSFSEKNVERSLQRELYILRRRYTLWYVILIETTVVFIIIGSVLQDCANSTLTYRAWLPYDYTPATVFYLTYIHQLMGMTITANINIACDSLIAALLQQICCQIEILEHRLAKLSYDECIGNCVCHHNHIYELVLSLKK